MLDPADLFRLEADVRPSSWLPRIGFSGQATPRPAEEPAATTMIVALEGFLDAGQTQRILVDHLLSDDVTVVASFDVDGSGDGGLVDFALSPTYSQYRLIYALITTPSDNRVVRIAPGDVAKPILTGIPKGATGNMGALYFRSPTELLVLLAFGGWALLLPVIPLHVVRSGGGDVLAGAVVEILGAAPCLVDHLVLADRRGR